MTLAIVFPGQGSQSVGMLAELAAAEPGVRATFAEASTVLGYDLWEVAQQGPRERLDATEVTQPAMLAAGVAVWRLWRSRGGGEPTVLSGHSLGEYTALVAAGALEFAAAVELVRFRGELMQQAVPQGEGAMAAIIGLDDAQVQAACTAAASAGGVVEPVNFNAPGQVVVAGTTEAVTRALEQARAAGARRAMLLPVSVPAHSSLMRPAADRMAVRLADTEIRDPDIPEIYTVDVRKHGSPDEIRAALFEQLFKPVRWAETVRSMIANDGVGTIVECGPGKVLTGLNRRAAPRGSVGLYATCDPDSFAAALAACGENA